MPAPRVTLRDMQGSLTQEIQELLEDFAAIGEQVWSDAESQARAFVAEGVAGGQFGDLGNLEAHRETLARHIVITQTVDFLTREGLGDDVDRVMTANGNGFSEADLLNIEDGIMPERDVIEGFRIRALCVHYAMVCDAQQLQSGLIQGE